MSFLKLGNVVPTFHADGDGVLAIKFNTNVSEQTREYIRPGIQQDNDADSLLISVVSPMCETAGRIKEVPENNGRASDGFNRAGQISSVDFMC